MPDYIPRADTYEEPGGGRPRLLDSNQFHTLEELPDDKALQT